jgi:DNA-binding transcriptional ArsR family regulator
MDRPIEDRLIAMLEAVDAPLSRRAIYSRVDEDFDSEEDLARALGRLVASGRLHRAMRPCFNKPDEAVYSTKPVASKVTSAQVTEPTFRVTAAKGGPEVQITAAAPKEIPMSKNKVAGAARQRVTAIFTADRGWMSTGEIAAIALMKHPSVKYHLTALEEQGVIQSVGMTSSRRYAIAGLAAPAAEPVPKKTAPKRKQPGPRKPARNLAEFGATPRQVQLPVAAPAAASNGRIAWAITDQGEVAINDGANTIQLRPEDIEYGISFLERTQLVWMRKAA